MSAKGKDVRNGHCPRRLLETIDCIAVPRNRDDRVGAAPANSSVNSLRFEAPIGARQEAARG